MSYAPSPKNTGLPREVVQWLQNLDLSRYPKNVRRDFSNGYLVAEIFAHYYPKEFLVYSYDKGTSFSAKQENWSQIKQSLQKLNLHLLNEVIHGTIHCKQGAAELLVQEIYTLLTNRRSLQSPKPDFTDRQYQEQLPSLARSTASQAIKNNLKITEIMAETDISANQRKTADIVHRHMAFKAAEKALNPGRFTVRNNVGQLATRNLVPSSRANDCDDNPSSGGSTSSKCRVWYSLSTAVGRANRLCIG
uniref:Spermatogenesis-associated protein 4 n=1 Tax=Sphaeramia orbicularis TaxID=375764 RepID=A0A672ZH30_9TELE